MNGEPIRHTLRQKTRPRPPAPATGAARTESDVQRSVVHCTRCLHNDPGRVGHAPRLRMNVEDRKRLTGRRSDGVNEP